MTPTTLWLIAGVAFMLMEAFGLPGVGFMFAGLGAIMTGVGLQFGLIAEDATTAQWTVFFIATAFWAWLLWKPLQRFHLNRQARQYQNMVGDTAYAGSSGLKKGAAGEATWSGTIMKAELAADAGVESIPGGAAVVIVDVKGATLVVKPKQ